MGETGLRYPVQLANQVKRLTLHIRIGEVEESSHTTHSQVSSANQD